MKPLSRRLARAAPWTIAAVAAWFAYAWLTIGWWALPLLAVAHAADGWRVERRQPRRRAPGTPRRHYGAVAAQLLAVTALLALVGYRPDWLIGGALVASAVLRWRDDPEPPVAAGGSPAE